MTEYDGYPCLPTEIMNLIFQRLPVRLSKKISKVWYDEYKYTVDDLVNIVQEQHITKCTEYLEIVEKMKQDCLSDELDEYENVKLELHDDETMSIYEKSLDSVIWYPDYIYPYYYFNIENIPFDYTVILDACNNIHKSTKTICQLFPCSPKDYNLEYYKTQCQSWMSYNYFVTNYYHGNPQVRIIRGFQGILTYERPTSKYCKQCVDVYRAFYNPTSFKISNVYGPNACVSSYISLVIKCDMVKSAFAEQRKLYYEMRRKINNEYNYIPTPKVQQKYYNKIYL
jgi:hypothetical protein